MTTRHILVVDDEPDIRTLLKEILEDEGFEVSIAKDAEEARDARRHRRPDLVLLDIWMPGTDGITLLKEWAKDESLQETVIMMSGHGTVETAVEATRLGAYDFIEKPLSIGKLLVTLERAFENASLRNENYGLKTRSALIEEPIGDSKAMHRVRESAGRIADHKTCVFISGESGTGKEVIARYIHTRSSRASGPFVVVNVAALPRENPEAELFGSESEQRLSYGSLEAANGGTLYLTDIADMDLNTQARLLGALETNAFLRVGGREPVTVDTRVIAGTKHKLIERVNEGAFRDDLFYHLNVLPLEVPPLREHNEDIDILTRAFLEEFAHQEGLAVRSFSATALTRLREYEWPGNVRELKNLVQRLLILGSGDPIGAAEVSTALGVTTTNRDASTVPGFDRPLREAREMFEKAYLEHQLFTVGGSVSKVSERVGIERTHLYRKLRSLGIDPKQIKEAAKE
ncbi:MAG: sigma-54 dependent transcriptional regulator [Pseudomonadota bacterium]